MRRSRIRVPLQRRPLPHRDSSGFVIVRSCGCVEWVPVVVCQVPSAEDDDETDMGAALESAVGAFFQDSVGSTCTWLQAPGGEVSTQEWVAGRTTPQYTVPGCREMLGLRQSPRLATEFCIVLSRYTAGSHNR